MFGPGLDHWGAEAIGLANVQRSLEMGEYLEVVCYALRVEIRNAARDLRRSVELRTGLGGR